MKSMYIRCTGFCALLALLCSLALSGSPGQIPQLTVTVYKAGHGDMIGILSPSGETTLIDCGDSSSTQARAAIRNLPARLARFIATHAHDDHIGNVPLIIGRTTEFYDPGLEHPSRAQEFLYRVVSTGKRLEILSRGAVLDLGGGAVLRVLWPPCPLLRGTAADANNNSLVLMLHFRNFRMLLTGDIETEALEEFMKLDPDLACTAVKIPHHGSRGSLHSGFIRSLKARWAIVSCAKDGDPSGHGLPHEDCLRVWRQAGMAVHATGREGGIRIETDGETHRLVVLP